MFHMNTSLGLSKHVTKGAFLVWEVGATKIEVVYIARTKIKTISQENVGFFFQQEYNCKGIVSRRRTSCYDILKPEGEGEEKIMSWNCP